MKFAVSITLLCTAILAQCQVQTTVCSVAEKPSIFHGKIVAIKATANSEMGADSLLDPAHLDCGRINLDLQNANSDYTTQKFVRLFRAQAESCDTEEQLRQYLKYTVDPRKQTPIVCGLCGSWCPRYRITAVFSGKFHYGKRETSTVGSGTSNLRLGVTSVSKLRVEDTQARSTVR